MCCRLWPAVSPNPLLTTAFPAPKPRTCTFTTSLQKARLAYLWDHTVNGRPLLPAAAMFEAVAAAARSLHGKNASFCSNKLSANIAVECRRCKLQIDTLLTPVQAFLPFEQCMSLEAMTWKPRSQCRLRHTCRMQCWLGSCGHPQPLLTEQCFCYNAALQTTSDRDNLQPEL